MFGTSGIRGRVGEDVTAELALSVGRSLGSTVDSAVVGRDPRESGTVLADALSAGLRECGAEVCRLGLAATPTVARSVAWRDADAGVSVTASHNPPPDNGIKLWTPSGQAFDESRRRAVVERIEGDEYDLGEWDGIGHEQSWDGATDRHAAALVDGVDVDAATSVVVDVGNGVGGVTADALRRLGCDVETLNADPDGRFPGRPSEPTADHCRSLCAHVAATDADLGVAHDGDADRTMAVDETGDFLGGDELLALFAREAAGTGDRVAAPLNTSLAVDDALREVGATVERTRVGDVFVAEAAAADGVAFGGEPSGAWIWPDETLCPDGPLAACKLAGMVSRHGPLSAMVDGLGEYPIRRESVQVEDKAAVMDRVATAVEAAHSGVETTDGVRVAVDDGWFLIRASGTQPLVRVTAEARDAEGADDLFDRAMAFVQGAQ
ncbi:phosphoglucosamine mutase [Halobacteriales archaeon QS_8_69_26]|nr:MAG: phosphoglucosamine mutase [Halobacteriales archaeon QS_8_69_26]